MIAVLISANKNHKANRLLFCYHGHIAVWIYWCIFLVLFSCMGKSLLAWPIPMTLEMGEFIISNANLIWWVELRWQFVVILHSMCASDIKCTAHEIISAWHTFNTLTPHVLQPKWKIFENLTHSHNVDVGNVWLWMNRDAISIKFSHVDMGTKHAVRIEIWSRDV